MMTDDLRPTFLAADFDEAAAAAQYRASGTRNTGFTPKKDKKPGMVCST